MDLLSSDSEEEKKVSKKTPKKVKSDETASGQLRVNQRFASEFERRERYKELQRAKEILQDGDDESDSESDESEDEDAELLSPGLDVKILQTINLLKKKDPKIYDPNTKWFSDPSSDESDDSESDNDASKKKMRYKDVLRQQLINDGAGDSDEDNVDSKKGMESAKKGQLLYDKEQEEIRKQFLKAAKNVDGSDDESSDDNLLHVKPKTAAEREEEERAYQQALEEMKQLAEKEKEAEDTAFLHQFLANKMWKDPASKKVDIDEDDYEEDEKEFDEAEKFESKYNFRFEELQADQNPSDDDDMAGNVLMQQSRNQVIGHARNVEDSLRRVDDKRKKQRESRKEKKEKEKRQKEAEIKRLKNLKKQELQERLAKISEMGGLKELGIDENFLEEDWDPEKHEKLMAQQFNDDYYEGEHDDDLAAILKGHPEDFDEDEHYNLMEDEEGNVIVDDYDASNNDEEDGNYDDAHDDNDADDGDNAKEKVSKLMDEYYALDYEDLIAGMPCRFKYRQVEPDDFGLSTEDILLAGDKELNDYVSLKKLAPYDTRYDGSSKDLSKKRKRLRALLRERMEAEEAIAAAKAARKQASATLAEAESEEKKKRKRRKRKHREGDDNGEGEGDDKVGDDAGEAMVEDSKETIDGEKEEPSKKKRKHEKKEKRDVTEGESQTQIKREEKIVATEQKQEKHANTGEKRKRKRQKHNKNKKEQPLDAKQQRLGLYK